MSSLSPEIVANMQDALRRGILHAEGALAALPASGARHSQVSFLEGRPGGLAVYAALLAETGRRQEAQAAVQVTRCPCFWSVSGFVTRRFEGRSKRPGALAAPTVALAARPAAGSNTASLAITRRIRPSVVFQI